jgi:hypothetical protein
MAASVTDNITRVKTSAIKQTSKQTGSMAIHQERCQKLDLIIA